MRNDKKTECHYCGKMWKNIGQHLRFCKAAQAKEQLARDMVKQDVAPDMSIEEYMAAIEQAKASLEEAKENLTELRDQLEQKLLSLGLTRIRDTFAEVVKELATLLQQSAKRREDSWNGSSYNLTISQAVERTCGTSAWTRLVDILLYTAWNDALEWAQEAQ